ncbi:hypothetical protein BDQ17DRAFT_1255292, partial [Cyathus striatus]
GQDIGVNWYHQFMKWHPDLKACTTQSLETSRANALNPTAVKEFYTMLKGLIDKYNIPAENIYNMDDPDIVGGVCWAVEPPGYEVRSPLGNEGCVRMGGVPRLNLLTVPVWLCQQQCKFMKEGDSCLPHSWS